MSQPQARYLPRVLGAVLLLATLLLGVGRPSLAGCGLEVRRDGRSWATIEDDGDIRISGRFVGRIDRDGTVRRDGRSIGRVESDGDIYCDGRSYGKIEDDGTLRVSGRSIGRIENDGDIYRDGRSWGSARPYSFGDRYWVAAVLVFFSGDF